MGTTQRHRKAGRRASVYVRAGLAFGLILGVGAAVTDASWTGTEFATATFTSSTFHTDNSVDSGTSWAANLPNVNNGIATFSPNAAMGTMSPGSTIALPLGLRMSAGSTVGGTGAITALTASPVGSALASAMRWVVLNVAAPSNCTTALAPATGDASWQPLSGSPFTAPAATVTLAPGSPTSSAGAAAYLCFIVQLPSGASTTLQGLSASPQWTITLTSN